MAYLVVNKFGRRGSIALQMSHGEEMIALRHMLEDRGDTAGLQVITLSSPDGYGEYAPYEICPDKDTFVKKALAMTEDEPEKQEILPASARRLACFL